MADVDHFIGTNSYFQICFLIRKFNMYLIRLSNSVIISASKMQGLRMKFFSCFLKSITLMSTFLAAGLTNSHASSVGELILLCKGGMDTSQVVEVSGEIEGKLKKWLKSEVEGNGSFKEYETISQYDLLKLVKDGVTQDLYKFDLSSYHKCIETMGPIILSTNTEIEGRPVKVENSNRPELVKIPIKTHLKNNTGIIFQYARTEGNNFVVALRLENKIGSNNTTFILKSDSVRLIGEDSVESFTLLSTTGLSGKFNPQVKVPGKSSSLVKFEFETPTELEPITLSSSWSLAGGAQNLGLSVTFHRDPLRITWIEAESNSYEFSGPPETQPF